MSLKDLVIGLVALLALGVGGYNLSADHAQRPLGATPGQEFFDTMFFRNGAVLGGANFATSSIGAATYTAAQLMNSSTITHTAASALTVTLPASSTLASYMSRPGDTKTVYLLPVTTGITFASATGLDLNTASSTKFCVAGQVCRLDLVRKSNTDIEALLTPASGI